MKYFMVYCWEMQGGGLRYENEFTKEHPVLVMRKWLRLYENGNNRSKLVFWQCLDDINDDVEAYADDCLKYNSGELYKGRDEE